MKGEIDLNTIVAQEVGFDSIEICLDTDVGPCVQNGFIEG